MRRLFVACFAMVGVFAVSACADDDVGAGDQHVAEEGPVGDDRSTFRAERARWVTICERAADDGAIDCGQYVDDAIDVALEAGCTVGAVEGYLETSLARGFDDELGESQVASCPVPLSTTVLTAVGAGFTEVSSPVAGIGLLDTEALARTFVDRQAMDSYLAQIGHQVSYARRWERPPGESLTVRLDRFADVAGAVHFAAPDPADEHRVVVGVDDGRIAIEEFDGHDGREELRQVAIGRVCNLAISVVLRTDGAAWDETELETLLVTQVHRVRATSNC